MLFITKLIKTKYLRDESYRKGQATSRRFRQTEEKSSIRNRRLQRSGSEHALRIFSHMQITLRVGVLVAILNKTQPDKHLGIVISASHNKREDNGVKITNFRGNMLEK
jgi:hypothetical protein